MLTGTDLGTAIDAARLAKNMTKKDLADHFKVSAPSVQGWIRTGRIEKARLIEVIDFFSDVVGPEHWGLSKRSAGNLAIDPAELDQVSEPAGSYTDSASLVMAMIKKHGKLSDEKQKALEQAVADTLNDKQPAPADNVIVADFHRRPIVGDEIRIAHYDVQGAMGGGKVVHDFPEMFRDVTVSQQHLRELGVTYKDPAHLKLITGDGQSMEPTIKDKDPLIADASIREFVGDGIYAFSWHGHFYIKRLQVKDSEHFKMISDNKHHDPEIIRIDETFIQARILLVWNANKL